MKKLSSNAYPPIVLMATMAGAIVESLRYEYFATRLLPVMCAAFVFVLAAVQLVKEISAKGSAQKAGAAEKSMVWEGRRGGAHRYLPIAGWIGGFVLVTYLLGFVIAIALFNAFYMKRYGSRWLASIITGIVYTAIIYFVFEVALKLPLYRGLLFS